MCCAVPQILASLGMVPSAPAMTPPPPPAYLPVMLDGKIVGSIRATAATALVER